MAWLRAVREAERLDLVLEEVWKGQQSALGAVYAADVLDRGVAVIDAEDDWEPAVVALVVADFVRFVVAAELAKGEVGGGDVVAVVVVEGCGADAFVLWGRGGV